MTEDEVLKIRHSLSERLPWPLVSRIITLIHKKLIEEYGKDWTFKDTARILNRKEQQIIMSVKLGKFIEIYPDLAKITNGRRAWRITRLYRHMEPDILRLKIAQEIQRTLTFEKRSTYDDLNLDQVTL